MTHLVFANGPSSHLPGGVGGIFLPSLFFPESFAIAAQTFAYSKINILGTHGSNLECERGQVRNEVKNQSVSAIKKLSQPYGMDETRVNLVTQLCDVTATRPDLECT